MLEFLTALFVACPVACLIVVILEKRKKQLQSQTTTQ